MGTNYYIETEPCPHCGRGDDSLHIGKSSAGWVFGLHVYPEDPDLPSTLEEWLPLLERGAIRDEYGRDVTPEEMLRVIKDRARGGWKDKPFMYDSWDEFHRMNNSEEGPNNLVRSKIDGRHCIGHGEGTWSLSVGDFS